MEQTLLTFTHIFMLNIFHVEYSHYFVSVNNFFKPHTLWSILQCWEEWGNIKKWIFSSLSGGSPDNELPSYFHETHALSLIDTLIHINDDGLDLLNRHHQYFKWIHIRETFNRWRMLGRLKNILKYLPEQLGRVLKTWGVSRVSCIRCVIILNKMRYLARVRW